MVDAAKAIITAIKVLEEIESMHNWLNDKDQPETATITFEAGDIVTAAQLEEKAIGNVQSWFNRLITNGHASADLKAPLTVPDHGEPAERTVERVNVEPPPEGHAEEAAV